MPAKRYTFTPDQFVTGKPPYNDAARRIRNGPLKTDRPGLIESIAIIARVGLLPALGLLALGCVAVLLVAAFH